MGDENTAKRKYWIKISRGFLERPFIKQMNRLHSNWMLPYLSLVVYAAEDFREGFIFPEIESETIEANLSLTLGFTEKVFKNLLDFLEKNLKIERVDGGIRILDSVDYTGSESESAERKRKQRERDNVQKNHAYTETESEQSKKTEQREEIDFFKDTE